MIRRSFIRHPLAPLLGRAVDSFCAALSRGTTRHYHGTVRNVLFYLRAHYPHVQHLDQLRRDPHILGWMDSLRAQTPPLAATASYINRLIALRSIFHELARAYQQPELAHMLRREDLPRPEEAAQTPYRPTRSTPAR